MKNVENKEREEELRKEKLNYLKDSYEHSLLVRKNKLINLQKDIENIERKLAKVNQDLTALGK